jgi:hypothetical protein
MTAMTSHEVFDAIKAGETPELPITFIRSGRINKQATIAVLHEKYKKPTVGWYTSLRQATQEFERRFGSKR